MTASADHILAAHEERIKYCEKRQDTIESKLDRLQWGIFCAAATSAGALLMLLLGKR